MGLSIERQIIALQWFCRSTKGIGWGQSKGLIAMPELSRITFDPHIMGGRACIRGMRVPVSLIVNLVGNGMTPEEILKEYPDLEIEDVRQAIRYAASLAAEELHPLAGHKP